MFLLVVTTLTFKALFFKIIPVVKAAVENILVICVVLSGLVIATPLPSIISMAQGWFLVVVDP